MKSANAVAPRNTEQDARNEHLSSIIRPLRDSNWQVHTHWNSMESLLSDWALDYGGVELQPDYQREHVWSTQQQELYVLNVLRGIVGASGLIVQFNCANWENFDYSGDLPRGVQCIDGLQRLTAVRKFMKGEIRAGGLSVTDLQGSKFAVKNRYYFVFQMFSYQRREEVLQHYLDINAGGTAHSQEEIARVRGLLKHAQAGVR